MLRLIKKIIKKIKERKPKYNLNALIANRYRADEV
jgi:hypothetical protein